MSFKNRRSFLAAAVLFCATALPQVSKAEAVKRQPTAASQIFVRTELYFGTNMPNGDVSDAETDGMSTRTPEGWRMLSGTNFGSKPTASPGSTKASDCEGVRGANAAVFVSL